MPVGMIVVVGARVGLLDTEGEQSPPLPPEEELSR